MREFMVELCNGSDFSERLHIIIMPGYPDILCVEVCYE